MMQDVALSARFRTLLIAKNPPAGRGEYRRGLISLRPRSAESRERRFQHARPSNRRFSAGRGSNLRVNSSGRSARRGFRAGNISPADAPVPSRSRAVIITPRHVNPKAYAGSARPAVSIRLITLASCSRSFSPSLSLPTSLPTSDPPSPRMQLSRPCYHRGIGRRSGEEFGASD